MWDIGSGASAALGALVGGGVTYAGTWLNVKFQSRQAKHARLNSVADRQYTAHQDFIGAMYRFNEASLDVHNYVDKHGTPIPVDSVVGATYEACWKQFSELRGLALLAGPMAVNGAVRTVAIAAADYANVVDRWICGDGKARNFDILKQQFDHSRSAYLDAAQSALTPRAH